MTRLETSVFWRWLPWFSAVLPFALFLGGAGVALLVVIGVLLSVSGRVFQAGLLLLHLIVAPFVACLPLFLNQWVSDWPGALVALSPAESWPVPFVIVGVFALVLGGGAALWRWHQSASLAAVVTASILAAPLAFTQARILATFFGKASCSIPMLLSLVPVAAYLRFGVSRPSNDSAVATAAAAAN